MPPAAGPAEGVQRAPMRGSTRRWAWPQHRSDSSSCTGGICRCASAGPRLCSARQGRHHEASAIAEQKIGLVVVDAALTPVQQRNLERAWNTKVIDRTGLILEIFGERARTQEGALQVELAHLDYQRSRLVRSWTHLERQRGGFGFLGGPGETQIEIDRRLIGERIVRLKKELEQVRRTRGLHRDARADACRSRWWRWSATPMPASRRCSTR